MQNIKKDSHLEMPPGLEWTREDSKELIQLYLQDYYDTLDDYYLERAISIAREHSINFQNLMFKVRLEQN